MAINGTDSTFLTINGGNLVIKANSAEAGGIYLRKGITFNYGNYSYNGFFSYKHTLDSEGNIVIKKGNFSFKPGYGKGIQSKKNLYLGQENYDNSDLIINIDTLNEGIEAERIIIFSGKLSINTKKME